MIKVALFLDHYCDQGESGWRVGCQLPSGHVHEVAKAGAGASGLLMPNGRDSLQSAHAEKQTTKAVHVGLPIVDVAAVQFLGRGNR